MHFPPFCYVFPIVVSIMLYVLGCCCCLFVQVDEQGIKGSRHYRRKAGAYLHGAPMPICRGKVSPQQVILPRLLSPCSAPLIGLLEDKGDQEWHKECRVSKVIHSVSPLSCRPSLCQHPPEGAMACEVASWRRGQCKSGVQSSKTGVLTLLPSSN